MSQDDPLEIFRQEAQDLLETIEQGLLDLTHRPDDRGLVDAVFRGLHTLKGSGAMFGFDALAAFTHHCESAFDQVRKGQAPASPELVAAVLAAQDHMRALAEGRPASEAEGAALLEQLRAAVAAGGASPVEAPSQITWRIRLSFPPDALANGVRPLPLLDELRDLGVCDVRAVVDDVPPLAELAPLECRLAWDVLLTTSEPRSAIEDVFIFVIDDMKLEIEDVSAAETEPESEVEQASASTDPGSAVSDQTQGGGKPGGRGESVRVPAERLDELMDRVGELVIAQSRLKQVADVSLDANLRAVSEEIERLAAELRETTMIVRMTPVGQLFGRFRRLAHDLARETGKAIELVTEGETTELDKTIIERLADPLVHLMRNAADHGLETTEQRLAAGKPAAGRITLSARQAGAEVVITIADDGRGVDRARVRAKAEEAGLVTPEAVLTDAELLGLIFQPGFSTAAAITSLSGRGVGMDVVKSTIEGLRGTLEMTSEPGAGSQVNLRIPLTLAIIDGLLVRVAAGRYVIPLAAVEECVELPPEQDLRSQGRQLINLRGRLTPFIRLRELFATGTQPDPFQKVVVVSTGADRVGLAVDQILGDHQTVIKSLSALHADLDTFSGATILGDGGVALILDVPHLVAAGQRQDAQLRAAS